MQPVDSLGIDNKKFVIRRRWKHDDQISKRVQTCEKRRKFENSEILLRSEWKLIKFEPKLPFFRKIGTDLVENNNFSNSDHLERRTNTGNP